MAEIKAILTGVVGLLIIASFIGYSGENIIDDVPKPGAGLCGVTKESYSDVPGSGAILDIEVDVSWDYDTLWIGIIDVETYESLEKLGGNNDGELVSCYSKIDFLAGGPSTGDDSSFSWTPEGDDFHIMIGSMEPLSTDQTFVDEFTVTVNYDASGGWGVILFLFILEIGLVYFATLEMR